MKLNVVCLVKITLLLSQIAEIESFEEKLTIGHANDVKKNTNDADGDNPGSFDSVCAICDNGGKITWY